MASGASEVGWLMVHAELPCVAHLKVTMPLCVLGLLRCAVPAVQVKAMAIWGVASFLFDLFKWPFSGSGEEHH